TRTFDALLRFDLADAKATLPPAIEAIDSEPDQDAVLVRFKFSSRVDVRTFREDNSYVVDVGPADAKPARQEGAARSDDLAALAVELMARKNAPPPDMTPPQALPARPPQHAASDDKRAAAQPAAPPDQAAPPAAPPAPARRRDGANQARAAAAGERDDRRTELDCDAGDRDHRGRPTARHQPQHRRAGALEHHHPDR